MTPAQTEVMNLSLDLEALIRFGAFDGCEDYVEGAMDRLDRLSELTWVLPMEEC